MAMSIGELARHCGCSVPTVRFYESIGLVPPAVRAANGRRSYGWPDVSRLSFVRRARSFGLSVDQVRTLLSLDGRTNEDCPPAKALLGEHLDAVRRKRQELAALERSLTLMLERCGPGCCEPSEPCSIISDMQAV